MYEGISFYQLQKIVIQDFSKKGQDLFFTMEKHILNQECPIEDIYAFSLILSENPAFLNDCIHLSSFTKEQFNKLYTAQKLTSAKIMIYLLAERIKSGHQYQNLKVYTDSPIVIFFIPASGNAICGNTMGLHYRGKKGAYPPVGAYHAASILTALGFQTFVFDLDISGNYEQMLKISNIYRDRICFYSMTSRFMGPKEYDLLIKLKKDIGGIFNEETLPFILAGGIGPVSCKEDALKSGLIDGIICGIAPLATAEMILDSDYCKDETKHSFHTYFSDIANIAYYSENEDSIITTHIDDYDETIRQIIFDYYNIANLPYETVYWPNSFAIAICSPDDLNISVFDTEAQKEITEIHPANYLFKPKAARFLSVIGNCPRNCRFCHWHTFDHNRYILSNQKLIEQLTNAKRANPHLEMIGWLDEDFLIWKPDLDEYFALYKKSTLFPVVRQSLETLPQYISEKLLIQLREANFKGIYLGFESPIKRLLYHMRKLRKNESFDVFRKAPYMCYDAGFVTRCSTITFYPEITEIELAESIDEYLDMIDYGISIEINPYVVAVPGSEMSESSEYSFEKTTIRFNNGYEVQSKGVILPKDKTILNIARKAIEQTQEMVENILRQFNIMGEDHDMSFEVISYFLAILGTWKNINPQMQERIITIEEKCYMILKNLFQRHVEYLNLQKIVENYYTDSLQAEKAIVEAFVSSKIRDRLWYCLQQFIDLGDAKEVFVTLHLLLILHNNGLSNKRILKSEELLRSHPLGDISTYASLAYEQNNKLLTTRDLDP